MLVAQALSTGDRWFLEKHLLLAISVAKCAQNNDYSASWLTIRPMNVTIQYCLNMHALVSSSMAALLLIQTLSGWCWQSPRECMFAGRSSVEFSQPAQCCEHGCSHEKPHGPSPCECPKECHGFCTYVIPETTELDHSDLVAAFELVVLSEVAANLDLIAGSAWQFDSGPAESELPVRLHLFHQVLLI